MLIDRGHPKVAIRLIWDMLNTTVYVIPKYLCHIKLIKGKALAVPRSVFWEANLNILFRISKAISYTTIRPGIDTV